MVENTTLIVAFIHYRFNDIYFSLTAHTLLCLLSFIPVLEHVAISSRAKTQVSRGNRVSVLHFLACCIHRWDLLRSRHQSSDPQPRRTTVHWSAGIWCGPWFSNICVMSAATGIWCSASSPLTSTLHYSASSFFHPQTSAAGAHRFFLWEPGSKIRQWLPLCYIRNTF